MLQLSYQYWINSKESRCRKLESGEHNIGVRDDYKSITNYKTFYKCISLIFDKLLLFLS